MGRRGRGVILYIKDFIQAYEIKLEREANCEEAAWFNIVTGNSTLTYHYDRLVFSFKYSILSPSQYGFTSNISTSHALIELVEEIIQ